MSSYNIILLLELLFSSEYSRRCSIDGWVVMFWNNKVSQKKGELYTQKDDIMYKELGINKEQ